MSGLDLIKTIKNKNKVNFYNKNKSYLSPRLKNLEFLNSEETKPNILFYVIQ